MADQWALDDANALVRDAKAFMKEIKREMQEMKDAIESGEKSLKLIERESKNAVKHVKKLGEALESGRTMEHEVRDRLSALHEQAQNIHEHTQKAPVETIGQLSMSSWPSSPASVPARVERELSKPSLAAPVMMQYWDEMAKHELLIEEQMSEALALLEESEAKLEQTQTSEPAANISVPQKRKMKGTQR